MGYDARELGIRPEKQTFFVNQGVGFVVSSNGSGNGTIKIYGVDQNLVRSMSFNYTPGQSIVRWDGRNDQGEPVHADVYWVVIKNDEFGEQKIYVAAIR